MKFDTHAHTHNVIIIMENWSRNFIYQFTIIKHFRKIVDTLLVIVIAGAVVISSTFFLNDVLIAIEYCQQWEKKKFFFYHDDDVMLYILNALSSVKRFVRQFLFHVPCCDWIEHLPVCDKYVACKEKITK